MQRTCLTVAGSLDMHVDTCPAALTLGDVRCCKLIANLGRLCGFRSKLKLTLEFAPEADALTARAAREFVPARVQVPGMTSQGHIQLSSGTVGRGIPASALRLTFWQIDTGRHVSKHPACHNSPSGRGTRRSCFAVCKVEASIPSSNRRFNQLWFSQSPAMSVVVCEALVSFT